MYPHLRAAPRARAPAVCGFSDQNLVMCFLSHDLDRVIILADVRSFDRHARREFQRVSFTISGVKDFAVNSCNSAARSTEFADDLFFPRSCNQIDAPLDHLLRNARSIASFNVAQIIIP